MKKILFFLLAAGITFIIGETYAASKRTVSSIVIDAVSGEVIFSTNADELRYPASLTKLMTLYITFDALDKGNLKFDDQLKISRYASNREPSRLGLKVGETIKVKDAILALIVKSANDCAAVLAESLAGNEKEFAQIMTQTAKNLGMKNTTFMNASGLPHPSQKTTARDMAILGSALYHHFPEYYDLFSTTTFEYDGRKYYTHNHLLKRFEGADGMKTGYTAAAGYNIVTSAEREHQRVIAVTMGHNTIKERDLKVAQLMNSGLKKLAKSQEKTIPERRLFAKLGIPSLLIDDTNSQDRNWAIQIGAFSNYVKARNYALLVQNNLHISHLSKPEINVEPAAKGAAVVYRSQLTGFVKNEADKICYRLKKNNKSCIVVASQVQQQLVMAEK
ncbi:MAG: D-alanyl-D-alanine carboxypeptidase [Alphaproteobacteria bacterium]|nr:D-alanyl-D-alanine carboxypeptidase [Alphaproteobacteria bacterium]